MWKTGGRRRRRGEGRSSALCLFFLRFFPARPRQRAGRESERVRRSRPRARPRRFARAVSGRISIHSASRSGVNLGTRPLDRPVASPLRRRGDPSRLTGSPRPGNSRGTTPCSRAAVLPDPQTPKKQEFCGALCPLPPFWSARFVLASFEPRSADRRGGSPGQRARAASRETPSAAEAAATEPRRAAGKVRP